MSSPEEVRMPRRSVAERLDDAVESVLEGQPPTVESDLRPLVAVAAVTADALRPIPPSARFEARLAARLGQEGAVRRAADRVTSFTRRELAQPGRLLAAGAVSTAAVGVTVTAFAVWRSARHPAPAHRLLGR
jgi:hypothetical protein